MFVSVRRGIYWWGACGGGLAVIFSSPLAALARPRDTCGSSPDDSPPSDPEAMFPNPSRRLQADEVRRSSKPKCQGCDLGGRIGAVLDRIQELGIEDNTYVIMVSDNGYRHSFLPGLTQPHHSAKWWVWHGGIRVPMIVKGPRIQPGSAFAGNVVNCDFLPTFVDWAGGEPSKVAGH